MPPVLIATCADLPDGDEDAPALTAALAAHGVEARFAVWSDPSVDWTSAPVILRNTWDYHAALADFLAWTRSVPRLFNDADVIAWNTDKLYLRDLADAGVPTVPTVFAAPGEPVELPEGEFVVKPSVGAGSRGAGRFGAGTRDAAREHAAGLHAHGRTVLVQPFLAGVDTAGETALLYAAGEFSHAIRKGAMLTADSAHAVDGGSLFVPENITARDPDAAELAVGEQALAAVRERFGTPLYARVDLLPSAQGPVVTELELAEPSLFLGHADGAADRFAAAFASVASDGAA